MIRLDPELKIERLKPALEHVFELSAGKIRSLAQHWDPSQGAPVITVAGTYGSRRWAEWTQGFQFGCALLQFDATGDRWFLDYGRRNTLTHMAVHLSHMGGHDHGFNNISAYGNLARLSREEKIRATEFEADYYKLALKMSGAVQAARWTPLADGRGYIYSFHGAHSLFIDTMRSLRCLAVAHRLGHVLLGEGDQRISLLQRLLQHASVTADYAVFYGDGRDSFDVGGRVAHESLFHIEGGTYCCPATQQGYSPFTTWSRGLAWAMLGFAEELEFLATVPSSELEAAGGCAHLEAKLRRAAEAACDYYLEQCAADGIPYWDTGAPGLSRLGDYRNQPANPCNDYEPVDSSAAVIAAQGLWRLSSYLASRSKSLERAGHYRRAALTIAKTLFDRPYLAENAAHQGLIVHSIYHRPNGWDHVPRGSKIPCGEACMWGDYHALELALLLLRQLRGEPYLAFFNV